MRTISVRLNSRERPLSDVMVNSKLSFVRSLNSFRTKTKIFLSEFEMSKVYLSKKYINFCYSWSTHTLLHRLKHLAKAVAFFIYIRRWWLWLLVWALSRVHSPFRQRCQGCDSVIPWLLPSTSCWIINKLSYVTCEAMGLCELLKMSLIKPLIKYTGWFTTGCLNFQELLFRSVI
jgi:hypothetical protein